MPLNFPSNPSPNDTYSFGNKTWQWNGVGWELNTTGAINDLPIGNVTPSTGSFTTLSAQTVNIGGAPISTTAGNLILPANTTLDGDQIASVGKAIAMTIVFGG